MKEEKKCHFYFQVNGLIVHKQGLIINPRANKNLNIIYAFHYLNYFSLAKT